MFRNFFLKLIVVATMLSTVMPSHAQVSNPELSSDDTPDVRKARFAADELACVNEHLETYLATGRSPLTIILAACPEADPIKALQKLARNSVTRSPQTDLRAVISLEPNELRCLLALLPGTDGVVTANPKAWCDDE